MTAHEGRARVDSSLAVAMPDGGIGFTDNSNPFYLFLKMNVGLLLLAPSILRREKSIHS